MMCLTLAVVALTTQVGAAVSGKPHDEKSGERRLLALPAWRSEFGATICSTSDGDDDHVEDLAVGIPAQGDQAGAIEVFSSKTGGLLQRLTGPNFLGERFAWIQATSSYPGHFLAVGYLARDSVGSVVLGAVRANQNWQEQTRWSFGVGEHSELGLCVVGDIDNDGLQDIVVAHTAKQAQDAGPNEQATDPHVGMIKITVIGSLAQQPYKSTAIPNVRLGTVPENMIAAIPQSMIGRGDVFAISGGSWIELYDASSLQRLRRLQVPEQDRYAACSGMSLFDVSSDTKGIGHCRVLVNDVRLNGGPRMPALLDFEDGVCNLSITYKDLESCYLGGGMLLPDKDGTKEVWATVYGGFRNGYVRLALDTGKILSKSEFLDAEQHKLSSAFIATYGLGGLPNSLVTVSLPVIGAHASATNQVTYCDFPPSHVLRTLTESLASPKKEVKK